MTDRSDRYIERVQAICLACLLLGVSLGAVQLIGELLFAYWVRRGGI